jgi:DNA-binding CsgD family transcriptional regulator
MATFWRRRGRPPYPDLLTPSEQRVLELIRQGKTNTEIANELAISVPGVKYHVTNMLGKAGVSDRQELARWKPSAVGESRAWFHIAAWKIAAVSALATVGAVVAVAALASYGEKQNLLIDNEPAATALPAQSAFSAGLLIEILDVKTDATRTTIQARITGMESDGDGVIPGQQMILIDSTGHVVPNQSGSADPANPRLVTWEFPPLSLSATGFTLNATKFEVTNRAKASMKMVEGRWSIPVTLNAPVIASHAVAFPAGPQLSGLINVFLDSVDAGSDSIVVTGHFENLGFEEVPAATVTARLRQGTNEKGPINLRLGFGAQREKFEMRFAAVHGEATLSIEVGAGPTNQYMDPTAVAALATKVATPGAAEFALTLP